MKRRLFLAGGALVALGGIAPSHAAGVKKVAMLWETAEGMPPDTDRRYAARLLREGRGTREEEARKFAALLEPYGFRLQRNLEILWFDFPVFLKQQALAPVIARMVAAKPDCIFVDVQTIDLVARATRTIPIVTFVRDPVAAGLAQSIARPGGNVTGIYGGADTIEVKSLDFLRRAMPGMAGVAWIGHEVHLAQLPSFEAAAREARLDVRKITVNHRREGWQARLAAQFAPLRAAGCTGAVLYVTIPAVVDEVTKLALRHGIAIAILGGADQDIERDGLLLRFRGADDEQEAERRAAAIVARILKGETPADIPFEGPARFQLAVNLRTARKIGVTLPPDLMILAERVID
jgi:putative ABC transport system substrate-binding protein